MASFLPQRLFRRKNSEPAVTVSEENGIRSLYLGTDTIQSSMRLSAPAELVLTYTHAMMASLLFTQPRRILHIGLGGGSLPRFCHAYLPEAVNDVVELHPSVVAVARSMIALPDDERMVVHIGDGVDFVSRAEPVYDLIFLDAFDGVDLIPAMVTEPFFHECRMALAAHGVLAVNLWRGHKHYARHVSALRAAFDGNVLTVPAETHGNAAALGLTTSATPHSLRWDALDTRATALQPLGLDFAAMIAALKRDNPHTASRLMPTERG